MRSLGIKHVVWFSLTVGLSVGLWTLLTTSPPPLGAPAGRQSLPQTKAELIEHLRQNPGNAGEWMKLAKMHEDDEEPALARGAYANAERRLVELATGEMVSAEQADANYASRQWYDIGACRLKLGREAEAREAFGRAARILEAYCELHESRRPLYNLACYASMAGERELAIEAFERALDEGWKNHDHATRERDLDPIRDDPRFRELLERINPERPVGLREGG